MGSYKKTIVSNNLTFNNYTVLQKKWRQNSNHYNYGTPYQNQLSS